MRVDNKNSKQKKFLFSSISLCSLLLFLVSCGSSSGEQSDTGSQVVQQVPRARLTYVAIGASDTFGIGADDPQSENWPTDLAMKLGPDVRLVNLGIPSMLLHQALNVEVPVALDTHPDLITVWLAVNDLADNVSLPDYTRDLNLLLSHLHTAAPHAQIVVANVPDLTLLSYFSFIDQQTLLTRIQGYNSAIDTVAKRYHVLVVDLYKQWHELGTHPEYISGDGLHPSTLGYARIADLFYQALQTVQEP